VVISAHRDLARASAPTGEPAQQTYVSKFLEDRRDRTLLKILTGQCAGSALAHAPSCARWPVGATRRRIVRPVGSTHPKLVAHRKAPLSSPIATVRDISALRLHAHPMMMPFQDREQGSAETFPRTWEAAISRSRRVNVFVAASTIMRGAGV
jgi:hypothetical protein